FYGCREILSISSGCFQDQDKSSEYIIQDIQDILGKIGFRLQDELTNDEILKLFNYLSSLIDDDNYEMLEGLEMIPLANGRFNKLNKLRKSDVITYLFPYDNENDLREILNEYSDEFITKDIPIELSKRLIGLEKKQIFNIKMLSEQMIADMVKKSLSYEEASRMDYSTLEVFMR
ncbi:13275_t:CDS:2, partial [Racocetra fulgida]